MTEQEAIKMLDYMAGENILYKLGDREIKAFEMGIKALEKHIAKKPLPIITDLNEFICMICPTCQQTSVEVDDSYCRKCGQKLLLDWGNEDAEDKD